MGVEWDVDAEQQEMVRMTGEVWTSKNAAESGAEVRGPSGFGCSQTLVLAAFLVDFQVRSILAS